jgi:hypothetical protein
MISWVDKKNSLLMQLTLFILEGLHWLAFKSWAAAAPQSNVLGDSRKSGLVNSATWSSIASMFESAMPFFDFLGGTHAMFKPDVTGNLGSSDQQPNRARVSASKHLTCWQC